MRQSDLLKLIREEASAVMAKIREQEDETRARAKAELEYKIAQTLLKHGKKVRGAVSAKTHPSKKLLSIILVELGKWQKNNEGKPLTQYDLSQEIERIVLSGIENKFNFTAQAPRQIPKEKTTLTKATFSNHPALLQQAAAGYMLNPSAPNAAKKLAIAVKAAIDSKQVDRDIGIKVYQIATDPDAKNAIADINTLLGQQ